MIKYNCYYDLNMVKHSANIVICSPQLSQLTDLIYLLIH